ACRRAKRPARLPGRRAPTAGRSPCASGCRRAPRDARTACSTGGCAAARPRRPAPPSCPRPPPPPPPPAPPPPPPAPTPPPPPHPVRPPPAPPPEDVDPRVAPRRAVRREEQPPLLREGQPGDLAVDAAHGVTGLPAALDLPHPHLAPAAPGQELPVLREAHRP